MLTLFHELGHVLLHGDQGLYLNGEKSTAEDEADMYVADVLIPCEYQHRLPRTRDIAAVRTARNQRLRMGSEPAAHMCMGRKIRRSPLFQHELS